MGNIVAIVGRPNVGHATANMERVSGKEENFR